MKAFADDEKIKVFFIPNNPETLGKNIKFFRTFAVSLKFWFSLLREIRRADIVHIFSSGTTSYIISTLPPLFAARFYRKKTILHYHTGEAETHLENWRSARKSIGMFDRIIVPSQFLVDVFARYGFRARAIFNIVETEKFKFRKRNPLKPVFLSNRNFEAHYRVGDIFRAFSIIQKNIGDDARLIVAGYGSEEMELKNLAADLQLKNAEFVGRVATEKMPEFYDQADVYLNSSAVDNMPLSIIEAYSSGTPVVSTDAGGIPYILENEQTGLLVKTGDYEALARGAMRLLENQTLADRIAENARAFCENFTPDKVQAQWSEVYREIVDKGGN